MADNTGHGLISTGNKTVSRDKKNASAVVRTTYESKEIWVAVKY
jgi:hypothetical protein